MRASRNGEWLTSSTAVDFGLSCPRIVLREWYSTEMCLMHPHARSSALIKPDRIQPSDIEDAEIRIGIEPLNMLYQTVDPLPGDR